MQSERYLDVDLSTGKIRDYEIPADWRRKYLGGRGIGARILLEDLRPDAAPLGSENIMVFGTGPLTGTGFPAASRNTVTAKSPKTGSVSDSSAGGYFPHELGRAGYGGIILRGCASGPVYLALQAGRATLHEAKDLWGLGVGKTVDRLTDRHGKDARVACIGPAGEKLVYCAAIINDKNRAAGRPGFGAVMGSKLLKAIVVSGGSDRVMADKAAVRSASATFAKLLVAHPSIQRMHELGTVTGIHGNNERGILPTRNFKQGWFADAAKISAEVLRETILTTPETCTGCPVRCKRTVQTSYGGEAVLAEFGGPEYETVAGFGSLCLNSDLASIALANQKCNDYGIDTISAANLIAMMMEATEKGLTKDGLAWGDSAGIVDMVRKIAYREGIGDLLAMGIEEAASRLKIDFAVHVKGQEVPLHEPRGKKSIGLQYATSPRGAEHMEGEHDTNLEGDNFLPSLGIVEGIDRLEWKGKPRVTVICENLRSFLNSAITCVFPIRDVGYENSLTLVRAAIGGGTGLDLDMAAMALVGERNYNLLKIHAALVGRTKADDDLPARLKAPIEKGCCEGEAIPDDVLRANIDEYYQYRGWNDVGPTLAKLRELDMLDVLPHYTPTE